MGCGGKNSEAGYIIVLIHAGVTIFMNYREPLFRPPGEADSLIFQVAYGCPHNGCRFCAMYKGVRYEVRPESELLAEIRDAGRFRPETRRIFLADGDVMALPFSQLETLLTALNRSFPELARVGLYANGSSLAARTPEQLRRLRELKLQTLYLGLESGDQALLDRVGKTENVDNMIAAGQQAQACGLRLSVMVLLGLAGRRDSLSHARRTAAALNRMQPRLLSVLRFIAVPGCRMPPDYEPVTEYEAGLELRTMVAALDLHKTVFRANHTSNPVPLEARFPADRTMLLHQLDAILNSGRLDRSGPGPLPWTL